MRLILSCCFGCANSMLSTAVRGLLTVVLFEVFRRLLKVSKSVLVQLHQALVSLPTLVRELEDLAQEELVREGSLPAAIHIFEFQIRPKINLWL